MLAFSLTAALFSSAIWAMRSTFLAISVLAAFSLARMKFWGSATLATGVFLTYLVPETLLFIPMFQIIGGLGLYNNLWAMVLIFPTLTVPFCTWIMIGYMFGLAYLASFVTYRVAVALGGG